MGSTTTPTTAAAFSHIAGEPAEPDIRKLQLEQYCGWVVVGISRPTGTVPELWYNVPRAW